MTIVPVRPGSSPLDRQVGGNAGGGGGTAGAIGGAGGAAGGGVAVVDAVEGPGSKPVVGSVSFGPPGESVIVRPPSVADGSEA
jgi:hypothetical protein